MNTSVAQPEALKLEEFVKQLPLLSREEVIHLFQENLSEIRASDTLLFKLKAKLLLIPEDEQKALKEEILANLNPANRNIVGLVDFLEQSEAPNGFNEQDYRVEDQRSADEALSRPFIITYTPKKASQRDDGTFHFSEADQKDIEEIEGEGAQSDVPHEYSAEESLAEVKKYGNIAFDDSLIAKRFDTIMLSFLKSIRKDIQILDLLQRSLERGGIGLSYERALQILHLAEKEKNLRLTSPRSARFFDKLSSPIASEAPQEVKGSDGSLNELEDTREAVQSVIDTLHERGESYVPPPYLSPIQTQAQYAGQAQTQTSQAFTEERDLTSMESADAGVPPPDFVGGRDARTAADFSIQDENAFPIQQAPQEQMIEQIPREALFSNQQQQIVQDIPFQEEVQKDGIISAPTLRQDANTQNALTQNQRKPLFGFLKIPHLSGIFVHHGSKKQNAVSGGNSSYADMARSPQMAQAMQGEINIAASLPQRGGAGTTNAKITDIRPPSSARLDESDSLLEQHKLFGPLDEISSITARDLRSFYTKRGEDGGAEYTSEAGNMFEQALRTKIEAVSGKFIERRVAAVDAWKQSPLNKMHVALGVEGLSRGMPAEEVMREKLISGEPTLTMEEFNLLSDINAHLRLLR